MTVRIKDTADMCILPTVENREELVHRRPRKVKARATCAGDLYCCVVSKAYRASGWGPALGRACLENHDPLQQKTRKTA